MTSKNPGATNATVAIGAGPAPVDVVVAAHERIDVERQRFGAAHRRHAWNLLDPAKHVSKVGPRPIAPLVWRSRQRDAQGRNRFHVEPVVDGQEREERTPERDRAGQERDGDGDLRRDEEGTGPRVPGARRAAARRADDAYPAGVNCGSHAEYDRCRKGEANREG